MTRKRLATTGERGALVRLYEETRGDVRRYVVEWGPKRQRETWPHTRAGKAEAEAYFKGFSEQVAAKPTIARLTTRELWAAYEAAEFPALRARTKKIYAASWRDWTLFYGADTIAEDFGIQQAYEFRRSLETRGLATETVRNIITNVRVVYRAGERHELIAKNKWHLYVHKIAKEKRTQPRAEYRSDEFLAIWRALDQTRRGQWRPWAAIGLLGIYGNRQNEILQMQWSWVEGDTINVPEYAVKTGEASALGLFPLTRAILDTAREWAKKEGYTGEYVLFPGDASDRTKQLHYSIQSLTNALHLAEARAGVPTIKWRAGHGFRRGLVGDLADKTGDIMLALQAIGDRDISMASRYRRKRNDRVDAEVRGRAERITAEEPKNV